MIRFHTISLEYSAVVISEFGKSALLKEIFDSMIIFTEI
jgi:hypothetical protein